MSKDITWKVSRGTDVLSKVRVKLQLVKVVFCCLKINIYLNCS